MLNPPLLEHAESERQHNKTDNNFFTNTPDIKKTQQSRAFNFTLQDIAIS